jgi:hypothetical protein
MKILIFPIVSSVRPAEPCTPNWNTSSIIKLSQSLKCAVSEEHDLFYELIEKCREENVPVWYNCDE